MITKIEKYPKYLYQYTTIDTLALILKNRTIKFNSLMNVDDMEEAQTKDVDNYGKFIFTSCWTDDKKENLALWNMYAGKTHGVRIKLPTHCFIDDRKSIIEQIENRNLKILDKGSGDVDIDIVTNTEVENIYNPCSFNFYHLIKVEYTDDESKIKPNLIMEREYFNDNDEKVKEKYFSDSIIGEYKRKYWEFQREWRYIIVTMLKGINNLDILSKNDVRRIEEFQDIPEGIYVGIDKEKIEQMEVMLGPSTNDSDRIIVEALIDKYNPKMSKPKDSYFKGKVRSNNK